ncbi:MAG TPA: PEP-CTERM sorting domain-containing protein [Blastocatellia bacterium]|nr:PEP-CTERM sorting domain-containing protein [Blastocatellia bacterium]
MNRKKFTGSFLLIALLLLISAAVKADPITLTSASLSAGSTNLLTLQGTGLNVQLTFQSQPLPYVYEAGKTTVAVSLTPATGTASNPFVINGVDYAGANVTGQATYYIDLRNAGNTATDTRTITGTLKVTDPQSGATITTLDFSFTASVTVTLAADPCGCRYITSFTAKGAGTAIPNGPQVPEPATMILMGSGLAAIAAKMRRRKSQRDQVSS